MRILIIDLLDFSRIGTNENIDRVDCNASNRNKITFSKPIGQCRKIPKKDIVPFIHITVE